MAGLLRASGLDGKRWAQDRAGGPAENAWPALVSRNIWRERREERCLKYLLEGGMQ